MNKSFDGRMQTGGKRGLLSDETLSVPRTPTRAERAGITRVRRKDRSNKDLPPENWMCRARSSSVHESTAYPDTRHWRENDTALALPRHLRGVPTCIFREDAADVRGSDSDRAVDCNLAAQMVAHVAGAGRSVSVVSDISSETCSFGKEFHAINDAPEPPRNTYQLDRSAFDDRLIRYSSREISLRTSICLRQGFACGKLIGLMQQARVHGLDKSSNLLPLTIASIELARLRTLVSTYTQYG